MSTTVYWLSLVLLTATVAAVFDKTNPYPMSNSSDVFDGRYIFKRSKK